MTPRPSTRAGRLYSIDLPYSLLQLNAETIHAAHTEALLRAAPRDDDEAHMVTYRAERRVMADRLEALYYAITGEAVPA